MLAYGDPKVMHVLRKREEVMYLGVAPQSTNV